MPALVLADRKIVRVDGADAEHFLQNLITANVDAIEAGQARPTALLTPQGKILFDFLISKAVETGYDCDIRADIADDFIRRLTLYKLRAAVSVEKLDDMPVIAGWGGAAPVGALADKRFPDDAGVWRLHGSGAVLDADRSAWEKTRITHGVAESGTDFALSDIFPHDAMMDKNDGVDFRKGCYVGQEVVSRMQHRGTARKRVAIVAAETDLPQAGPDETDISIVAGEKTVGSLGSTTGNMGLAMVRTDRVADALADNIPLTAGGMAVTLTLPKWSGLSFASAAPDT
ncbi:folate-binding protein YgfZ [Hoeflea sp. IMCC20628]|uniref:CAF17-like 4Fe-4S cluster assembly/insertion protein YgfZ n=1 Tax=Hoeflea sp. IMCC20628 TaxID=1620421 RepID=UPI00063AC7A2|nr:folate-binding protein YgfZ [Hoeflea sp. IMCC20628]AKH99889.1 folate-binding protein YgfZ [Hoeflea sp. IMCC20628]